MTGLVGYVWLILTCWLLAKAAGWLIFRGGLLAAWTEAVMLFWEMPLRWITGRPVPDRVRAEIERLERDLGFGTCQLTGDLETIFKVLRTPGQVARASRPIGMVPVSEYLAALEITVPERAEPVRVHLEAGERVIGVEAYRQVMDHHMEQLKRGRS